MINRKVFFDSVLKNFGKLKQSQVDGFGFILTVWEESGLKDLRWLAYMLATTWHETARTMQPIEEYGKGHGKAYGVIDPKTGFAYYGRGYVQLTWASNYKRMGELLKLPLYEHPTLALDPKAAARIMFEGMILGESHHGDFTGKSLENYFNDKVDDPVSARRIINGMDHAELIASSHRKFLSALGAA